MNRHLVFRTAAWLLSLALMGAHAQSTAASLDQIEAQAAKGDAEAEFLLAKAYANGTGIPKDEAKARALYKSSADQGNAKAMTNLSTMYFSGAGGARDPATAALWARRAAEAGAALAQTNYASLLEHGVGVAKDETGALTWYQKAADQGEIHAEAHLGMIYFLGKDGVKADPARALPLISKAAEAGDPLAQDTYGKMYETGQSVPKDLKEATKWYTRSAKQGFAPGETDCGRMCYVAGTFPYDSVTAYMWFMLASWQNDVLGKHYMREFDKTISDAQLDEAKKRAQAFQPQKETPSLAAH